MFGSVGLVYHILIYDLQAVIVDITLVDKCNVLGSTIIAAKYLNIVFLYLTGLFDDMVIGISYGCAENCFHSASEKVISLSSSSFVRRLSTKSFSVCIGR